MRTISTLRSLLALALLLVACGSDPSPSGGSDAGGDAADLGDLQIDSSLDAAGDADLSTDPNLDAGPDAEADAGDLGDPDAADLPEDSELSDASPDGDAALADADVDSDAEPACDSPCDCPQGQACRDGACVLEGTPTFCCTNPECPEEAFCEGEGGATGICEVALAATFGAVVFNEVLIDGASDGDPNGDGEPGDSLGDEFVELLNRSDGALDLSGYRLVESTLSGLPRHVFGAEGEALAPGDAIVVFGGGTAPDDRPGARFVVANAADPGIPFGLSLENDAEVMRLVDADGALVAVFAYGPGRPLPALADESYTRPDPPEDGGAFVPHTSVAPGVLFSPGTRADGTSF